jgi:flagellin-like hook-associated protein FlgL
VTVDTGTPITVTVDLSGAETAGDIATRIESAIRDADPTALVPGFGAGVTFGADRFRINAAAGATVTFSDGPSGQAATALGLANHNYVLGVEANISPAADLDPRVTADTTLGSLAPSAALDLGNGIRFRNGTLSGTVALSAGMTVGELAEEVKRLNLGIRVEVSASGDSINVVNEVSGLRMSVEEFGGASAALLGVRTLMSTTPLSVFNDGRGVEIADGNLDVNGLPDAARNVDFRITLSSGVQVDVDLTPANSGTVGDVVAAINAAVAGAGVTIGGGAGEFQAVLSGSGNGIVLEDRVGAGGISITNLNGHAAEDLGLLDGTTTTGPAILTGSDRTSVRVDSLFTTLLELGASLGGNDERGITFAGERLETDLDRISLARATVGARAQRVDQETGRLEDRMLLDKSLRSEVRDLDLFEATTRFTLLETQLQAVLQTASRSLPLTLLNFL